MAGSVSLFRKWRSQNFADLLGQDAVVRTLRNVLSANSPARAYLFCGPRGTGKTSTARIFAKALCCEQGPTLEPCNACSTCHEIASGNCMDVLEIDAASHTQVDKIRDFIVDKVHFAPARARFKVYIIDEVHKLSSSSFNALLKTLEEPPPHVVFILATTHPHELLPTILSRCQRYDFRPFSLGQIRQHLEHVAQTEGFTLEVEAALCLARAAGGSMRDALVLLEQAYAYCGDRVHTQGVTQMLGWLPAEMLEQALGFLQAGQAGQILNLIQSLAEGGQDFVRFVDQLVDQLRMLMLLKVQAADSTFQELPEGQQQSLTEMVQRLVLPQILAWLRALIDTQQAIREGGSPRLLCEMTMVQLASGASSSAGASAGLEALQKRLEALEAAVAGGGKLASPPPTSASVGVGFVPPRPAALGGPPSRVDEKPTVSKPAEPPRRAQASAPLRNPFEGGLPSAPPPDEGKSGESRVPEPPAPSKIEPPSLQVKAAPPPPKAAEPAPNTGSRTTPSEPITNVKQFWIGLLSSVRKRDTRLFAILGEARPVVFEPPRILVTLPQDYTWHQDNILKSRALIESLCQELLDQEVKFECQLDTTGRKASGEEEHKALVKKASGLFAGKIVQP